MSPPADAPPPVGDNEFRKYEEPFVYLSRMAQGHYVQAHVITDVNPFNRLPETLPGEDMLYFINSMENNGAEGGFWKARGEPREIFGNASINGWEATHEFYEGQGPHAEKTNWLMLEYYITPKVSGEAVPAKDGSSICKVFRSSSSPLSDTENHVRSQPPDNSDIPTEQRVTNQMQVDTTSRNIMPDATSLLLGDPAEILPELLDQIDPNDYIDLSDFGFLLTPSPRSDNESCMTVLSDDCFDYLEAMLEAEIGGRVEHEDAGRNLSVSDFAKPDDDAVVPAAISGLPIEERSLENASDGKAVNRDSSPPLPLDSQSSELPNSSQTPSADGRSNTDGRLEKLKRKHLPSSSSQSSDGSNNGRPPSPGPGGITRADGTMKKLQKKYRCFMPF